MATQEIGKDPLYQKSVTTFATTYLLGYRSVFIRPNNNGGDTSFEKLLPTGTIVVDIPMVKDSPLQIVIHAENIVVARGTKYFYPGKDLTISCRSAIFVSHPHHLNMPVTFDLSGEPQLSIPADPPAASRGTDRIYNAAKDYGTDGSKGIDGTDGATGFAGGKFTFKGDMQLPLDAGELFKIVTTGGKGGRAGNGGLGGTGGDGWQGFGDARLSEDDFRRMLDLLPGRAGGEGGRAGRPGYGGSGGDVNMIWTVNGKTPVQDEKFKRFENLFIIQADAGQNGDPGEGGLGGLPGKGCQKALRSKPMTLTTKPVESYVKIQQDYIFGLGVVGIDSYFLTDPAAIPAGATGSRGAADIGAVGAQPSAGKTTIVPADAYVLLGLQKYSPRQLLMIIERLSFEYFVYFSSQFYHSTESLEAVDKIKSPFGQSFAWISSICNLGANEKNKATVGPDTLLWKEVYSSFGTLCRRIDGMKDIFDCSLISVEQPHLGLWEVESILKGYINISNRAQVVREYLREGAAKRLEIRVVLKGIAAQVTIELSKRTKAIEDLKSLQSKIVAASAEVTSKERALRERLEGLEDSIQSEVNCNVSEILTALGTVALFFSPHVVSSAPNSWNSLDSLGSRVLSLPLVLWQPWPLLPKKVMWQALTLYQQKSVAISKKVTYTTASTR